MGNTNDFEHSTIQVHPRRIDKYFILAVLVISSLLFLDLIRLFFLPILLSAVFATLFYPLFRLFLRLFRNRRTISSLACCLTLFLVLLIPLTVISDMVARQGVELYQTALPRIKSVIEKGDTNFLGSFRKTQLFSRLKAANIDWQKTLQDSLKILGSTVASIVNKTSQATIGFVVNVFVVFFIMFYFFRDGERITAYLRSLIPLNDEYKDEVVRRFTSISRATIKGTLVIGLIQGTLGAVTLLVFGVDTWVLWGVVMVLASILPVIGAWIVLIPAGIIQIMSGEVAAGITIILVSTLIVGTIDNILRPVLVGRDAGMHDLLIFFSTLGGISIYGVMGFVVGPMIAAIFLTVLDIYTIEFGGDIHLAQKTAPARKKAK